MEPSCHEVLLIPLGGGVFLRLEEDSASSASNSDPFQPVEGLLPGSQAIASKRRFDAAAPGDRPPFLIYPSAPDRGLNALRLFELRDYYWELQFGSSHSRPSVALTSNLAHSTDRDLWKARDTHGRFRFVNYLGSAWIQAQVTGSPPVRIPFEVTSPKLDYEQEYRAMIEAIGEECQQLLLEWGTPASLNLALDPTKQHQTLLEQFLFLRHVLGTERLDLYLEIITRRPHSRLERELAWKPAGSSDPALLLSDPLRYGRDWRRTGGRLIPGDIQEERKFDSLDTPPNCFLKFALESFRNLCEAVLTAQCNGRRAFARDDAVSLEASSMLRSLDVFLALPLFETIGDLRRIPFDSTTLQRREGYRELLLAWLMLDAAAQLDWPGREEVYDGTSRDVATLYEYWLYFLLIKAFRNQVNMEPRHETPSQLGGELPFCCRPDDGRLVINLQQGKESYSRFTWESGGRKLLLHFFYNRSFSRRGVTQRGTYSKTFRPDFTLVILPEEFATGDWAESERRAEAAGKIAYLHFDAKYRIETLAGVIGEADSDPSHDELGQVEAPDACEKQREEARGKASGTAKNADLYKMHTYNDAIRRTIGSYVLYPGDDPSDRVGANRFQRYHEIIPGIGAFALRPPVGGRPPQGLTPLCDFIRDVLAHQLSRFTQSYRITTATEDTIRETPLAISRAGSVQETVSLPSATAVLGYMRKADIDSFKEGEFFYCQATDDQGTPLTLDISAAQGALFIGWWGSLTGPYQTTQWMARIVSCRLVGSEAIKHETGVEPSSGTVHYLLFKLADVSTFSPRDITDLVSKANQEGKGGKFRTFQTQLKDVMQQNPAASSASAFDAASTPAYN